MSKIALTPNASGTGTFTLAAPNSNVSRTLTLPDTTGTLLDENSSLPAANITGTLPAIDGSSLTGLGFRPVAVTGTTPSLDVGTYSYFDNGTLTADTTVSFASVPTNAQWQYTFTPSNIATAYDTPSALNSSPVVFITGAQDTDTRGLFFKPDGLKMYHAGGNGDGVYEYDLSTAWDITTATYLQLKSVTTEDTAPEDVHFSPDGIYMYVHGQTGDDINQYTLSTAWNVTTASFTRLFSVAGQSTGTNGMTFNAAGTKMYTIEQTTGSVHEYTLTTAWDLSTASFLQSLVTSSGESVEISPDGTLLFAVSGGGVIKQYTLSTAYDVTTGTLTSTTDLGVVGYGIHFKSDGLTLYLSGSDRVTEYPLVTLTAVTLPAAVVETPAALTSTSKTTYNFTTLDGGTTVNLIDTAPQSTSYAAVGSYILGRRTQSVSIQDPFSAGTPYAGSTLYPAGFSSETGATDGEYANNSFAGSSNASVLSGTWRSMGTTQHLTGKKDNPVTVFVRTA